MSVVIGSLLRLIYLATDAYIYIRAEKNDRV